MSSEFADAVAKFCYEHYKALPKTGKPQMKKEWTLLAAIVINSEKSQYNLKVASLCTGTKCLGYSQLSDKGDVIFDSHAEVLARRAFVRFLYHQISLIFKNEKSEILFFEKTEGKFKVKAGIKFHLFISHTPCGDASIFTKSVVEKRTLPLEDLEEGVNKDIQPKRIKIHNSEIDDNQKMSDGIEGPTLNDVFVNDIYRTGAKCVESGKQDSKKPGKDFHITGALRTKPGRGDPTWSMSCSDKIALWNVCGLQGALLSLFLAAPIYLDSLIFGKCPLDKAAVERAVVHRLSNVSNLPPFYKVNKLKILQSSLPFEFSKEELMTKDKNALPCSAAIIWCPNFLNVCVNGRKQGITKKNVHKPTSRIDVCKSVLFETFLQLVSATPGEFSRFSITSSNNVTYKDYKVMAEPYQKAKESVFKIFIGWKRKSSSLQQFIAPVNNSEQLL